MDLSAVIIRHGEPNVLQTQLPHGEMRAWKGTPRTWTGITIVAAGVEPAGPPFAHGRTLAEHLNGRELPSNVRTLLLGGYDGRRLRSKNFGGFLRGRRKRPS